MNNHFVLNNSLGRHHSLGQMFAVLLLSFVTIFLLDGCVGDPNPDARQSHEGKVVCSPYSGTDTDVVRVLDLESHTVIDRENYYTFHYNKAEFTNPACLSLDFGKLCKCDIASQTVLLPLDCPGGRTKDVTEIVFRRGSILNEPTQECPDRSK